MLNYWYSFPKRVNQTIQNQWRGGGQSQMRLNPFCHRNRRLLAACKANLLDWWHCWEALDATKKQKTKHNRTTKLAFLSKRLHLALHGEPRWLGSAPWPLTLNSGMPMEITRKGVLSCSEGAFRFPCVLTILPWGWPSGLKVMAGNRIPWWQSSHCRFPVGCWNCSTINESWDMTGRWSYWVLP